MTKYVDDLQLFSKKLCSLLKEKEMTDKNGRPDPIKLHNVLYPQDEISIEDIEKFGRSSFTEKTRKERNWINGENYPKRIGDILLLCNTFECNFDYFFTDMPHKTHDEKFIHDYTGLSDDAIGFLHEENSKNDVIGSIRMFKYSISYQDGEKPNIDLLNYLLHTNTRKFGLLDHLYQFIFHSDFKYCIDNEDCLNTYISLIDGAENNESRISYHVSQLHNSILLNITNCLSKIREKYIEDKKQDGPT